MPPWRKGGRVGRKNYYTDCHKGRYNLVHPEKYMQNAPQPYYKSKWEQKMFCICDLNPNITFWGYEPPPISIPYMSPRYNRMSIYKPDIYLECMPAGADKAQRWLIEIKPSSYSSLPKVPQPPKSDDPKAAERYMKRKATYEQKVMDVMVNTAKWEAAVQWCERYGVHWFVANEKNMGHLFDASVTI